MKVNQRKRKSCQLGPNTIPIVPVKDFNKARNINGKSFDETLKEMWDIIGPSVDLNLHKLPLWKVITMAYFEGVVHGSQMIEEENEKR